MSINGVLEDLPLADVLQFIHLGRRTGTLYMWHGEKERAEIGFHDGRIISAWTPGQARLGDRLVARGLVDRATLEEALAFQRDGGKGLSIGHILIDRRAVTRDDIYTVIRDQIQQTVFNLVAWRHGYFQFEVDELHPSDDFGVSPEDLLENLDLNTQMLVLEATRLFDEGRRAATEAAAKEREEPSRLEVHLERAGLAAAKREARAPAPDSDNGRPAAPAREAIRCQVVSPDPDMLRVLARGLAPEMARVVSVPLREAGNRMPGEGTSPIVVLDLRDATLKTEDVATLARTRPAAPVVALVGSPEAEDAAYGAGALAVVPSRYAAVVECCRNLIRVLTHPQPQGGLIVGLRGGFSRFRRVVFDVQSGLASATMALNLMHLISDSVERAILFLVRDDTLAAVGAFGFSDSGAPLAQATRGLIIRPSPGTALERVVKDAEPQVLGFDEAGLPEELAELVGRPASGQIVLFPVHGAERTISVIYTDNGSLDEQIEDVQILELATSQVGMAFENELLRQELGDQSFHLEPEVEGDQRSTQ
jgi:hypothetical protein